MIFTNKQGRGSNNSAGYKIQKTMWRENLLAHTFSAKVHKANIRVKRWHNKYEILNLIERHNFCLNYLLIKSNRTALQTYKVEERTFVTSSI